MQETQEKQEDEQVVKVIRNLIVEVEDEYPETSTSSEEEETFEIKNSALTLTPFDNSDEI